MGGATLALSLAIGVLAASPARSGDLSLTPSLQCSGGWTDNVNGGVEEASMARPPVAAPFVLLEPELAIGATPAAGLRLRAGYRAGLERYNSAAEENAFAHRVDGSVRVDAGGPAFEAEGSWNRKDYPAGEAALDYRAGRGAVSASLPVGGDRATTLTAGLAVAQWRWPSDLYPVNAMEAGLAARTDLATTGRAGVRLRFGRRVIAGVQGIYTASRSHTLVASSTGPRERFSWTGPGAVVSAGLTPGACTAVTLAAQVQQRGYRDWLAGDPPARVTGQAVAVLASGSWACSRVITVVLEYAYLRHDAPDPALRLRAQRVSLGLRLAPRFSL